MSKLPDVDWVSLGPDPVLATCARCGGTVARPPLPMEMGAFSDYLRDALEEHASCQEAGDGEDEAAVRRPQPAPAEGFDEEAGRASPAAPDGAAVAAGGVADCICTEADDPNDHRKDCPRWATAFFGLFAPEGGLAR